MAWLNWNDRTYSGPIKCRMCNEYFWSITRVYQIVSTVKYSWPDEVLIFTRLCLEATILDCLAHGCNKKLRTAYYIHGPELMKLILALLYVPWTMGLARCDKTALSFTFIQLTGVTSSDSITRRKELINIYADKRSECCNLSSWWRSFAVSIGVLLTLFCRSARFPGITRPTWCDGPYWISWTAR